MDHTAKAVEQDQSAASSEQGRYERGILLGTMFATRNKCIASSNKCLTSSNKKLLGTMFATRTKPFQGNICEQGPLPRLVENRTGERSAIGPHWSPSHRGKRLSGDPLELLIASDRS